MADQNVDIVIRDLGTDATRWDLASSEFAKANAIIQNLTMAEFVMDGLTFSQGGTRSYNATHEQIQTLLSAGVTETARIAQALRNTATNMTNAEQAAGG